MGFIKKNLPFTIVVAICVLAFVAGAYLAFAESGKIGKAKQKISRAETQLNGLLFADPAPSPENVDASQENVIQLEAELKKIRDELQRGARLTTSTDGIGVMASIQQFITEYQRGASSHTNSAGEDAPIEIPNDFGFGFEQYLDEAAMLDDTDVIPVLDKQRQILSYLLSKLYDADPKAVTKIERELLENSVGAKDSFQISDAVSASVPGAVDTLAFSLTFEAYTDSLRKFLNNLAQFDLPIVVRSIEVERPTGGETTAAPSQSNNLDAIFGAFGGSDSSEEPVEEAQEPVISENISTFTVVLEFIEVVIPAGS